LVGGGKMSKNCFTLDQAIEKIKLLEKEVKDTEARRISVEKNNMKYFNQIVELKKLIPLTKGKTPAEYVELILSNYINILGHELITPQNGLEHTLNELKDMIDSKDVSLGRLKDIVCNFYVPSYRRLREVTNKALRINKCEEIVSYFSFVDMVEDSIPFFEKEFKKYRPELSLKFDFSGIVGDTTVFARRDILYNAICEYFKNAARSMKFGEINARVENDKKNVKFLVVDQGCGIKSEVLDDIFIIGTRAHSYLSHSSISDNPYKYNSWSYGLGLSIVRNDINSFNGNTGVSSVFGKGSTFWFTLPVSRRNENREAVVSNFGDGY